MKSRTALIRAVSFLTVISVLLAVVSVVSTVKLRRYKQNNVVAVERSLSELSENLNNITVSLQKGCYCSGTQSLSTIASELSRSSACAKTGLEQISDNLELTDEIYKFLSQVGDFTQSLISGDKEEISEKDGQSVKKLYTYSQSLSEAVDKVRQDYLDGELSLEKLGKGATEKDDRPILGDSISDAGQAITDYPVLTYDGPFSDSRLNKTSTLLEGKNEITAEEAKALAAKYLETDESRLRRDSDENGKIKAYCFSTGEKTVAVTKNGGYLCYMTNPDYSGKSEIGEKEAIRRAKQYLEKMGYTDMEENYYADFDGVCTINFAHTKDEVTYYPDLIKVSVSLSSGEVQAIDAKSYLMNHEDRTLPKKNISRAQAASKLKSGLSVLSSKLAVIPTDYQKEKLCYEFHCKDSDGQEVLIYKNVENGNEESILILLISENGTLTV